jgi:hypothetical protein
MSHWVTLRKLNVTYENVVFYDPEYKEEKFGFNSISISVFLVSLFFVYMQIYFTSAPSFLSLVLVFCVLSVPAQEFA